MSTQVQLRRGTAAQHATFVGAPGEITVDTTNNTLRVHDGITPGGHPLTLQALFDAHLADNAAHGATASAIANRIVVRDESGGASFSNFGLSPTRSTIDLNDRLVNGWSTANTNTPNTPEPGVQGVLFTSMWDNDAAGFQLFFVLGLAGEDKVYFRRRANRIWFPWVRIWHSGNTIVDSNGFIKEV